MRSSSMRHGRGDQVRNVGNLRDVFNLAVKRGSDAQPLYFSFLNGAVEIDAALHLHAR